MLNEFFNELAYNPGKGKAGFLFFLAWANHNLNSVVSTADAHGPVGRSLIYFNCEVLPILNGVAEVNDNVNLLVGLLQAADGRPNARAWDRQSESRRRRARGRARHERAAGPFGGLRRRPSASASAPREGAARARRPQRRAEGRG